MDHGQPLKFQPLSSVTDVSFWHEFAKRKLNEYKLSEDPVPILGVFSPSRSVHVPSRLYTRSDSFELDAERLQSTECEAKGSLFNVNTIESFKNIDKDNFCYAAGKELLENIANGNVEEMPSLLVPFCILSFSDLKKHKFVYWFCFPTVPPPVPFQMLQSPQKLIDCFEPPHIIRMVNGIHRIRQGQQSRCPFFVATNDCDVMELRDWKSLDDSTKANAYFVFVDPCPLEDYPGWPLRNFLLLLFFKWKIDVAKVICFRETLGSSLPNGLDKEQLRTICQGGSIVLNIKANIEEKERDSFFTGDTYKTTQGWEKNAKGKMGPRLMDLSAQLDPVRLADSACDLNLRLMRWRALPELDTELLSRQKCLLFGAGTLGCAVARSMLGWGIRNITFVDNGRVSYSNPVRQSLFNFEDCQNGGKFKATAAAEALKRIFPGVNANGIVLTIPMPGHMVTTPEEVESTKNASNEIADLIKSHDVVILLTDTRESRWLPSLLCAKYKKLTLNAALGFDTFLVMRHGCMRDNGENMLGCYFCNDVVAPQNSMKDRTLDQQCTVTRPGLAPIASAILVELLINLLHHPERQFAAAPESSKSDSSTNSFGVLPHQIRGYLGSFNNVLVQGPAFPQCTACSKRICSAYESEGFDMLIRVFNDPSALEQLTGLHDLQQAVDLDNIDFDGDWSDGSSELM